MNLNEIFEDVLNGDALLFCGAGFSYGATAINGNQMSGAGSLIKLLCEQLEIQDEEDLEYLSEKYKREFGGEKLLELLKSNYTATSSFEHHKIISELPWKRIYTTNYDNVLELSSKSIHRKTATLSDNPTKFKDLSKVVMHLNGSIDNLSLENLNSEIKLTGSSYLSNIFNDSQWHEVFSNNIKSVKSIIFIGFSLSYDLDIKRIISNNEFYKNKIYFINGKNLKGKNREKMEWSGTVIDMDSQEFSEKITAFKNTYDKPTGYEDPLYCFDKFKANDITHNSISHKDISDLLFYGRYNNDIYSSNISNNSYLLDRKEEDTLLKEIESNKKIIVVHSNLGNGKSIFIEKVKNKLSKFGDVFHLNNVEEDIHRDLEIIFSQKKGKTFIIIENYNNHLEVLKLSSFFNIENVHFILTARSFVHDLTYNELLKLNFYNEDSYSEITLNSINHKEILSLVDYFNRHKLWGKNDNLTDKKKIFILKNDCNSNLRDILVHIINSDIIKSKIMQLISKIKKDKNSETLLLMTIINNLISLELDNDLIINYLNLQGTFTTITRNQDIKELIDPNEKKVKLRSSVLSDFILNSDNFSEKIVDLLIKLMKKVDNLSSKNSKNIRFSLISFSNFQLLVKNNNKNSIIRYYENLRNLNSCQRNSFFWIQYANARISLKQFDEAKLCLDNAYAHKSADIPHYDTCYARWLLENQMHLKKKEDAFEVFSTAHELLFNNKNTVDRWHFPFKQVKLYDLYYNLFYNSFSKHEQSLFLLNCKNMYEKIEKYIHNREKKDLDKSHQVITSQRQLRKILLKNKIFLN